MNPVPFLYGTNCSPKNSLPTTTCIAVRVEKRHSLNDTSNATLMRLLPMSDPHSKYQQRQGEDKDEKYA
jgi:hypothetical protein